MNKLNNIDFSKINEEIKNQGLPKQENDADINIDSLYKKLPFTWGLIGLDNTLGLLDINRLVIVAGEGGSGKTTYTMQQALKNADNGKKVAYMSLEMGRAALIKFIAKKKAGIEKQTEIGQEIIISEKQKELFNKEIFKLQSNKNLSIKGYTEYLTQETFEKELNNIAKDYDLIFIDNLGMIGRGAKESELLPMLTQAMLKVRQNNNVTIVALHHMSKGNEKQVGPRGKNAIRGSGKILDDADKIITIARTDIGTSFAIVKDRDDGIMADLSLTFNRGEFSLDVF